METIPDLSLRPTSPRLRGTRPTSPRRSSVANRYGWTPHGTRPFSQLDDGENEAYCEECGTELEGDTCPNCGTDDMELEEEELVKELE